MKAQHAIRNIIIIVFCLIPLRHWALSFDEMLSTMDAMSLPQINVMLNLDSLSSNQFTPGMIVIAEHNGEEIITTQYNCLVRHRGKTALQLPKMSLSIKLVDEEGENLDVNLLGLRTDNSWNLDAMGIDKMRMRNRVCFDIWNEYSHTMWDTKFGNRNGIVGKMVELFINGQYNGIYHLSDKVNRQLLNLRKAKTNDDGTVTVKGLLYKGAHNGISNNLLDYTEDRTDTTLWNTFELQYPDDYTCLASWQPFIDLIDFNGKTELPYFREHYNEWYYTDNLIDYFILLIAFNIDDMPYNNTFLSIPDINFDHRYMITPWDLDACLGRGCDGSPRHIFSYLSQLTSKAPYNRLITYNIDGFKQLVKQRWDELSNTVLSPDNVESHITEIAQRYIESGAWQREYERWKDASDSRVIIGENLNDEVNYVMQWYRGNHSSLNEQFVRWSSDYVEDPNIITSAVITSIYNYLLGIDTSEIDKVDINKDGIVTAADITAAYDIMLNNNF